MTGKAKSELQVSWIQTHTPYTDLRFKIKHLKTLPFTLNPKGRVGNITGFYTKLEIDSLISLSIYIFSLISLSHSPSYSYPALSQFLLFTYENMIL